MKRKLTATAWSKLEAALQGLYKKVGDNYVFDKSKIEKDDDDDDDDDDEEDTPLKRAKDREKERAKKAEDALKAAQDELKALKKAKANEADDEARNKGDVATLEASWKKKYDDREKELLGVISEREADIRTHLIDSQADAVAREISTTPKAMARLLKDRLTVEVVDGKSVVRVLDSNGKPSAATLAELKKEIMSDKELSGMLIGSKASGGGANGGGGAGGGAAFKIEDYQNPADKTILWSKVAAADKETPGVLAQVKAAIGQGPATSSAE